MDQKQIARQMIQFNKTAFDTSFNAKAISDWMQTYKKGCEDFKKLVNDNYEKVEAFFAGAGD